MGEYEMSVTIKDIAKHAGVSYSTVSKALRNSPLVKEPTKNKIIAIADELGYIPNIAARSLVQKKSFTIGVVWPTLERVAPAALITKINELLEERSYTTLLSINEADRAISTFNRFQVDAIIVFAENEKDYSNEILKNPSTVPILYYGIKGKEVYPIIDVNRRLAMKLAVENLVSIGHEKIAFIGEITTKDPLQKEKYKGYMDAMKENRLSIADDIVVATNGLEVYDGYLGAKALFNDSKDFTAIISGSFDLTKGILKAANELDIHVPNDVSIISYDNISTTENEDLPVTKVGVPIHRIAEQITDTLMEIIDGKEIVDAIILEPELNNGESCKKIM